MNYLGKVINNCRYIYNEINAATLTGAIDVVVVEQPDGTYSCSPFHVRFGKMGVLRSKEKVVDIEINGEPVDIHMKLGESGEAFFVEEVELGEGEEDYIPPHLACSPIPPDGDRFKSEEWQRFEEGETTIPTSSSLGVAESTPKTFRAETVEQEELNEIVRKLSSTEFRPITGQPSETSLSSQDSTGPEFSKEDSPSADERTTTNKRKRKKKSAKKKHSANNANQKRNSVPVNLPPPEIVEDKQEQIFQMEDLDNPTSTTNEVNSNLNKGIQETPETAMDLSLKDCSMIERDIHFFSDTEITPGSSPRDEFAPVQSDSEFETKRIVLSNCDVGSKSGVEDQPQSWRWGELPTPGGEEKKQESQKWMLQNMLGFMKKTKHIRHKNESEGIYLSEVNSEDPEMAALYFPSAYKENKANVSQDLAEQSHEEDAESGHGPSLPQSPHSVEGNIYGPKSIDSDFESQKSFPDDLALSTCGLGASPDSFQENMEVMARISESEGVFIEEPRQDNKGKVTKKGYSWFTWSRQAATQDQQPPKETGGVIQEPEVIQDTEVMVATEIKKEAEVPPESTIAIDKPLDLSPQNRVSEPSFVPEMKKSEFIEKISFHDKFRKSLRLTSEQIACLNLRPGANEIEFSVTTAYQGTSKCKCFLFCWRYDDKIVVSDIDGTITKSDVLGHILPIVGKDWAQSGVAKLFTKIKDNGYKLLYLSARAIGQSRLTREYLKSIKQEDMKLPEGPMLLNPTSLLTAFHTEVIEKKPEEFKISCLRDIQALFPPHVKPFYAGYGNKINDVWAYQAVGIPITRIFTINHRGELKHELTQTFQSSYTNMSHLVDHMFPASKVTSSEHFSQFNYWREPIMELPDDVLSSSQI